MINKGLTSAFQSAKIQQNAFCRFANTSDDDYQNLHNNQSASFQKESTHVQKKMVKGQVQEVVDLEDLWNSLENESKEQVENSERGKIRVSIMNIQQSQDESQPCEITDDEFEKMLAGAPQQQINENFCENQQNALQVEDLGDIWDQVQQEHKAEKSTESSKKQQIAKQSENLQTSEPKKEQTAKVQRFDINSLFSQKFQKSYNFNLGKDYLIYDYQTFVMGCFETNVHSYFGFTQSDSNINSIYHFYNLMTKEVIMQCTIDTYDQSFLRSSSKKMKVDYEIESCLKFRLPKSGQLVATAFHKYINNGILYNIKPYNHYENQYEDSLALIEISDGFIGNNCYCNTNVYISQKYTNQPGQLKMIIGLKNGYLIANMGVNGIKSAPYNCRLQNYQSNFVYLLGMVDKESSQFIIRVGEGMSPLIAFAISIGRKRYIDSFTE